MPAVLELFHEYDVNILKSFQEMPLLGRAAHDVTIPEKTTSDHFLFFCVSVMGWQIHQ